MTNNTYYFFMRVKGISSKWSDMPRGPRQDAPGTFHHVILRVIEKRKIVDDDKGRVRQMISPPPASFSFYSFQNSGLAKMS